MGVFDRLGQSLGNAMARAAVTTGKAMRASPDVEEINFEVARNTIDPKKFQDPTIRKLAEEIVKASENSPASVSQWIQDILDPVFEKIHEATIAIVVPPKVESFEEAKAAAGRLQALVVGFILLTGLLDAIATSMSATFIRNVVHVMRAFVETMGISNFVGAYLGPAVDNAVSRRLQHGYAAQYQPEIPGPGDLVRFELREVFRTKEREELIYQGTSKMFSESMAKMGFSQYWADSFWAAHWELPSIGQLNEMLQRHVIDEETWESYVKRNDYVPSMMPQLKEIIYSPFTRVDIRRMWDLGVLTDEESVTAYEANGYNRENAEKLLMFTKLERKSPDLRRRFRNGWMNQEQLLEELTDYGLSEQAAQLEIETLVKNETAERVAAERDLTKSEIIKGVKKGLMGQEEALNLLYRMGYGEKEAEFVLAVNLEVEKGPKLTPTKLLSKSEIISGLEKGQIEAGEAVTRLVSSGYKQSEAELLIAIRTGALPFDTLKSEKERTRGDILKALKQGLFDKDDAKTALLVLGYPESEANFILSVHAAEEEGSPETLSDFSNLVEQYRDAQGQSSRKMSGAMIVAEEQVKIAQKDLDAALAEGALRPRVEELMNQLSDAKAARFEALKATPSEHPTSY